MSTLRQKVAVYLGLAEEDYGFDYDERTPDSHTTRQSVAVEQDAPYRPAGSRRIEAVYDVVRMTPHAYADIKGVAESYRSGDVVSMDLARLTSDDAKRMIDFASGLTFGLSGTIERLGGKVFLLTPKGVEVAASVKSALQS
ncbi:MAG: cell division protein SepF [Candidatus Nanopelagicales bacterium]